MKKKCTGFSYINKVRDVNNIYDTYARSGLSNREILRRYIWPKHLISEKTFYNYLNPDADPDFLERLKEMEHSLSIK